MSLTLALSLIFITQRYPHQSSSYTDTLLPDSQPDWCLVKLAVGDHSQPKPKHYKHGFYYSTPKGLHLF